MLRRSGALLIALLSLVSVSAARGGDIAGRVTIGLEGMRLSDIGPTVVFLEGGEGASARASEPALEVPTIRQRDARFAPEFLVVRAGQGVSMPNDDTIFHNVFSFSRPNDFDLGVYPSGDSKTVAFEHAGLVKLYCSIHESMSGAVLVTPSDWFTTVSRSGGYRVADVPAGEYTLTVWNEKLPLHTQRLSVSDAGTRLVDIELGGMASGKTIPAAID